MKPLYVCSFRAKTTLLNCIQSDENYLGFKFTMFESKMCVSQPVPLLDIFILLPRL